MNAPRRRGEGADPAPEPARTPAIGNGGVGRRVAAGASDTPEEIVGAWRGFAGSWERAGEGLGGVRVEHWSGVAHEGFHTTHERLVRRALHAHAALDTLAEALDVLAQVIADAAAARRDIALAQAAYPTDGSPGVREAPAFERLARWNAALSQALSRARDALRSAIAAAPTTSVFSPDDAIVAVAVSTELAANPSSTAPPQPATAQPPSPVRLTPDIDGPVTLRRPITAAAAAPAPGVSIESASAVETSPAAASAEPPAPPQPPPVPGAALRDRWAADDPRRLHYVVIGQPSGGIHDSLYRATQRATHDHNGNQWPKVFDLSQHLPQPDAQTLTNPHLARPGWVLAIPPELALPSPDPADPGAAASDSPFDGGHSGLSQCLPPPGAHDDPASPVRTGPASIGLSPETGVFVGVLASGALVAGIYLVHGHTPPPTLRTPAPTDAPAAAEPAVHSTWLTRDTAPHPADNPTPPTFRQPPPHASYAADPGKVAASRPSSSRAHTLHEPDGTGRHDARRDPVDSKLEVVEGVPPWWGQPHRDGLVRDIGIRAEHTVIADLAAIHGLGLHGDGATAALRAMLCGLLTPPTPDYPTPAARVIIPHTDAQLLLTEPDDLNHDDPDDRPNDGLDESDEGGGVFSAVLDDVQGRHPAGLDIVTDLDTALDELEIEINHRIRLRHDTTPSQSPAGHTELDPPGPVVLIASIVYEHPRLQAILDIGAALGITAILLGPWAGGTSCLIDPDGQVLLPIGPAGLALARTRLYTHTTGYTRTHLHALIPAPLDPATHGADHTDTELTGNDVGEVTVDGDATAEGDTPVGGVDSCESRGEHALDVATTRRGTIAEQHDTHAQQPRTDPDAHDQHLGETELRAGEVADPDAAAPGDRPGTDPHSAEGADDAVGEATVVVGQGAPAGGAGAPSPGLAAGPHPSLGSGWEALVSERALVAVCVFGPLRVFTRHTPGAAFSELPSRLSPTSRLLLACLGARTDPVPAAALIESCWPDTPGAASLKRLHTAIYRLRTQLRTATAQPASTAVISNTAEHYYQLDEHCWVDHHAFHTALRASTQASTDLAHRTHTLATACQLYTGTLLAEIDLDWLPSLRESARRRASDAARTLAEHLTPTHPDQAGTYLAAALAQHPDNEALAQHLIRHHLTQHQPDAAHRVYTHLTDHLTALGHRPDPTTAHLRTQITHALTRTQPPEGGRTP